MRETRGWGGREEAEEEEEEEVVVLLKRLVMANHGRLQHMRISCRMCSRWGAAKR